MINKFRMNDEKDEGSKPPVYWSDELYQLCLEHAQNMAAKKEISHDGV